MSQEVYVRQRRVLDFDDVVSVIGGTSIPAGGALTKVAFQRSGSPTAIFTRTGSKARLAFVGNAVAPGGEDLLKFHLKINGSRALPPYDEFGQQMGTTFDGESRLAVPVDLPQNAMIEIEVENASSTTAYAAFVRLRIEYEEYASHD